MLQSLFGYAIASKDEKIKYQNQIHTRMNQTNAKRAIFVLFLGIIMELFLIAIYDIPNIIQNGWTKEFGLYYLIFHSTILVVSVLGTIRSHQYLKGKKEILAFIPIYRFVWVVSLIFLASLAMINGLDQVKSDSITIYSLFTVLIAVFVLLPPSYMGLVISGSFITFIIGQVLFQTNDSIVFTNITNGTLIAVTAYFISYTMYQSFVEHTITSIKLKESTDQLEILSITDPVTEIYNRRKYDENLTIEIARAKRTKIPFSLLMIDIDFFKLVNDEHGHPIGDLILHDLAKVIEKHIRKEDTFARYGGEEFALILTNTALTPALEKAMQIRKLVESHTFTNDITITVSVGVSQYKEEDTNDTLTKRTDKALYIAKHQGRNRVQSL